MKIAWVHYHLKTGGVTTVLRRQIAALQGTCECLVLTGDRAAADWPCRIVEIPGLGYDRPGRRPEDARRVADRVLDALRAIWPDGGDVLHIHNPILAKNRQFLSIIKRLQQSGVNLFLQVHDFAEDGRPEAYVEEDYPADCHYGVINGRDGAILKRAGLVECGLHHLPNAVETLPVDPVRPPRPQVLYPVRAIRRKNLGEAALLALFLPGGQRIAVTQPPNSPVDRAAYRDWSRWVAERRLPLQFDAGSTTSFGGLIGESLSMVTTSIAEGFGFSFLEPWTAGKWVWGRRLEGICDDFAANGVDLGVLYDRLSIPLAWFDAEGFSRRWTAAVHAAAVRLGHPVEKSAVRSARGRLLGAGHIDFGLLNEKFQRQAIASLLTAPHGRRILVEMNPWLANAGRPPDSTAIIDANRRAVEKHYGVDRTRERLLALYDRVVRHPVRQRIDKAELRRAFFDLDRFSLLKWGNYDA